MESLALIDQGPAGLKLPVASLALSVAPQNYVLFRSPLLFLSVGLGPGLRLTAIPVSHPFRPVVLAAQFLERLFGFAAKLSHARKSALGRRDVTEVCE